MTTLSTAARPITITEDQLRELLESSVRRATPITFIALTTPEQRKIPELHPHKVKKLVRVNGMTGCFYANAAAKMGVIAGEERAWGDRESSALVTKPGPGGTVLYYLPVQVNRTSRPMYLVQDGPGKMKVVPNALVQPYLRPEREQKVEYRDYGLRGIVALSLNRQRYRVVR